MDVSAPKLAGKGGGPSLCGHGRGEEVSQMVSMRTGLREAADSVMSLIHGEVTR